LNGSKNLPPATHQLPLATGGLVAGLRQVGAVGDLDPEQLALERLRATDPAEQIHDAEFPWKPAA
jgi:hypothetical protein